VGGRRLGGSTAPHIFNSTNLMDYLIHKLLSNTSSIKKGANGMSAHEEELFKIIGESDDPEQAVLTAIKVFAAFLAMPQEPPERIVAALLESAGKA
jgi:hypothetical protein